MSSTFWRSIYNCFSDLKSQWKEGHDHSVPSPLHRTMVNSLHHLSHSTSNSLASSAGDHYDPLPDLPGILASPRFFLTRPGHSSSIFDYSPESEPPVAGSVTVRMFSPDPYSDFLRSMQEMIETCELEDVEGNWEYLRELLLCYLTLNPKRAHPFIITAFADLLISLEPPAAHRKSHAHRC